MQSSFEYISCIAKPNLLNILNHILLLYSQISKIAVSSSHLLANCFYLYALLQQLSYFRDYNVVGLNIFFGKSHQ